MFMSEHSGLVSFKLFGSSKVQIAGTVMRVAVIADIHGNQIALEAVLRDLAQQVPIDQTVIAGDLCLNGPRPKEVLKIVYKLQCPVIRGNVDMERSEEHT